MVAALAEPAGTDALPVPGTCVQWSLRAGAEYSQNLVQPAANSAPVPVQRASTANASLPTVSRLSTRRPPSWTGVQFWPLLWVAHSAGPNAHPFTPSRNRIWLTPMLPFGGPIRGAGTPCQVLPPSLVPATDVQYCVKHRPGIPACPITQPVLWLTKVTEVAAKLTGTDGGPAGTGWLAVPSGVGVVEVAVCELGRAEVGVTGRSAAELLPAVCDFRCSTEGTTRGSATTASTITTAAAPAETADTIIRRALRRLACFLICSKVPGGGCSGSTCAFSQVSRSSCGSVTFGPSEAGP